MIMKTKAQTKNNLWRRTTTAFFFWIKIKKEICDEHISMQILWHPMICLSYNYYSIILIICQIKFFIHYLCVSNIFIKKEICAITHISSITINRLHYNANIIITPLYYMSNIFYAAFKSASWYIEFLWYNQINSIKK